MTIAHTINFNLKYNSTDLKPDPIQKEYSEKFSESMKSCLIYDTIEDKGQKIYFVVMEQIV